jgi:microcystin-dependent protein
MGVPAGTVISYVGTEASLNNLTSSGNWLACDGTSYATDSYPDLYAAIGYTFGQKTEGGKTYFYVPDLRGMFLRGIDAGTGNDPDSGTRTAQHNADGTDNGNTGDNVGSWQVDAVANHQHNWDHFFFYINYQGSDLGVHQPADSPNLQQSTRQATNNDGGVKTGS